MRRRNVTAAFSLIEVVLAVGVCAGAIVTILALLPMLARDAADAADLRAAQQMSGALETELRRIATVRGVDAWASAVPPLSTPLSAGFALVGARDGISVKAANETAGDPPQEDQYFLIEVYRFSHPPMAHATEGGVLPLYARVSWPYRARGAGAPTLPRDRRSCEFTLAINR